MGREKIILLVIVAFAFLVRFIGVSSYPSGFNADEVNQGYTAYSILKTGKDEWGEPLPIAPRSYGDFRAPLYTYLAIPSVALFGLSEFAVRLPAVLMGTLAVLVVYLLARELFGSFTNKNNLALWSAFLLAVSPWHIALSRGAFEPNLPSLLVPAGILFFLKAGKNRKYMLAAAIVLGVSLFAYYSSRLLFPVTVALLYFCFVGVKNTLKFAGKHKLAIGVLGVFVAVAVYTMFWGASTRVADVSVVSETSWRAVSETRYNAVLLGLPDIFSRLFNNKLTYVVGLFGRNYLDYFSTRFLFTQGAGEATYGMLPGLGLLYLIEALFLLAAFVYIIVNRLFKSPAIILVLAMILVAPIPAALATGPGMAANRAALMMPWIQILSGLGAYAIFSRFSNKYLKAGGILYFAIAIPFFLHAYFFRAPIENTRSMSYGWRQAAGYVKSIEPLFERVVVSRKFSEPQMFIAFYMTIDPLVVQAESKDWLRYEEEGLKFVDQLGEYRLGKYVFKSINPSDFESPNTLVMGKPEDFKNIVPDYVVYYPDAKEAIYFVSSGNLYAEEL